MSQGIIILKERKYENDLQFLILNEFNKTSWIKATEINGNIIRDYYNKKYGTSNSTKINGSNKIIKKKEKSQILDKINPIFTNKENTKKIKIIPNFEKDAKKIPQKGNENLFEYVTKLKIISDITLDVILVSNIKMNVGNELLVVKTHGNFRSIIPKNSHYFYIKPKNIGDLNFRRLMQLSSAFCFCFYSKDRNNQIFIFPPKKYYDKRMNSFFMGSYFK